jgi:hypothetical protein
MNREKMKEESGKMKGKNPDGTITACVFSSFIFPLSSFGAAGASA